MPERLYTESEVAAIIAQAAERQQVGGDASGPGLTLAEIERAGREAGLDSALLRQAAADLDAGRLGPTPAGTTVAERWIDGAVSPNDWADAVADLRLSLGSAGMFATGSSDITTFGADQEWSHHAASGATTTVTLSPRDGRTRLRVVRGDGGGNSRVLGTILAGLLSLLAGLLAGAVVAETLALGNLAGMAALLVVSVAGTAVGGPAVTRAFTQRREQLATDAERLADDLARRLAAPAGTVRQSEEAEPIHAEQPRLGLDLDGPDAVAPESAQRRRARA